MSVDFSSSTADIQPVSEQEESLVGDWEILQKLKHDNERVEDQCLKFKAIEKFMSKIEKQAAAHVIALKSFYESAKSLADTFREFYHFAQCDPCVMSVSDEFCIQTQTAVQQLPRAMEKEYETNALPFLQSWQKEINKVRELHKQRENAKRKYIHYINKLQMLGEKPKKGVVLSEKKQTQVKRNRLKLDEAKKFYEKITSHVWFTFDVCWDCQFTQLNPMFCEFINVELKTAVATQHAMTHVEDMLVPNLASSYRATKSGIDNHARLAETIKEGGGGSGNNEEGRGSEVSTTRGSVYHQPMDAEEVEKSLLSVKIEYDLNDMLATVLDNDITQIVNNISDSQLCSQMPIVGAVLATFPRQSTTQALTKRAIMSPCVAQCVGFLKECDIVRPRDLLADIETNRDLIAFFIAFDKIIATKENVVGLDFRPPASCFHPFQVTAPLKRFVVQHAFLSNAKPVLLAAFSEYEDNQQFNEHSSFSSSSDNNSSNGSSSVKSNNRRSLFVPGSSTSFSPLTLVASPSDEPPIPPRPSANSLNSNNSLGSPSSSAVEPPIPPRPSPKVPIRPKYSVRLDSIDLTPPSPSRASSSSFHSSSSFPPPPPAFPPSHSHSSSCDNSNSSGGMITPNKRGSYIPSTISIDERKEERSNSSSFSSLPAPSPTSSSVSHKRWEILDQSSRLPDFIFKSGDDLRTDQACLHLFRLMNHLWKSQNLVHKQEPVQAKVYKVQAITPTMGLVEYVPGCYALSALTKQAAYGMTEQKIDRIVATSVAGYIAAYILGIKDRHSDNILIMEDATVFHIDFGHILGRGVTIDTGEFAITPEFKIVLEEWYSWHAFVDLCVKAFLAMRTQSHVVAEFAHLVLSPIFPDINIGEFVKERLMVDVKSTDEASMRLRKMVSHAPTNYKTRLKNLVHGANTAITRTKNDLKSPKPQKSKSEVALEDAFEETDIIAQGRLLKKSPKGIGRYQDRYFELLPLVFRYRTKQGASVKGEIELRNVEGVRISETSVKEGCEFEIDVKNIVSKDGIQGQRRTFTMRATSADEATFWIRAIKGRLDVLFLELKQQNGGLDLSGRSY